MKSYNLINKLSSIFFLTLTICSAVIERDDSDENALNSLAQASISTGNPVNAVNAHHDELNINFLKTAYSHLNDCFDITNLFLFVGSLNNSTNTLAHAIINLTYAEYEHSKSSKLRYMKLTQQEYDYMLWKTKTCSELGLCLAIGNIVYHNTLVFNNFLPSLVSNAVYLFNFSIMAVLIRINLKSQKDYGY